MRIWDVKHGNAIFVRTPDNKNLVYDLGRGDYSENSDDRSPLETLYDHYGVRDIHYLVITHPHRDHIDDILNIDKFNVKIFKRPRNLDKVGIMSNISERDKPKYDKYFALDTEYVHPVPAALVTSDPKNYGDLNNSTFETPGLTTNLNNRSIFTVLEYQGIKVIIPGDNEYASLDLLMQKEDFKAAIEDCDVLIAPHHGRESAYHSAFVKLANPRLIIVSDGSLCDTSANARYSAAAKGWNVYRNGQPTQRKMLTTNTDGEVYIDFGHNGTTRYLSVQIK